MIMTLKTPKIKRNAPLLGGLGLAIVQLPRVRAVSFQQLQILELQNTELDLHRGARDRLEVGGEVGGKGGKGGAKKGKG